MHYRNGREAKNGDKIVRLNTTSGQIEALGIVASLLKGAGLENRPAGK